MTPYTCTIMSLIMSNRHHNGPGIKPVMIKKTKWWPVLLGSIINSYNNSSCMCGPKINNLVDCENDWSTVHLQSCHCMSYMDKSDRGTVVMGACPYLCTNYIYMINANNNLSNLCNSNIQQNRQGHMCGQCKDNHSPSPYSYQLKCAHCSLGPDK